MVSFRWLIFILCKLSILDEHGKDFSLHPLLHYHHHCYLSYCDCFEYFCLARHTNRTIKLKTVLNSMRSCLSLYH